MTAYVVLREGAGVDVLGVTFSWLAGRSVAQEAIINSRERVVEAWSITLHSSPALSCLTDQALYKVEEHEFTERLTGGRVILRGRL
ncbi:MAG: hypothetical protein C4521_01900 [Actinobacteria bacterium]|nr:MAG: hypothetical protein C4521_01900 [Actinomycetota bacterium]